MVGGGGGGGQGGGLKWTPLNPPWIRHWIIQYSNNVTKTFDMDETGLQISV